MKQIIRLTEGDLHRIIRKSVNEALINELDWRTYQSAYDKSGDYRFRQAANNAFNRQNGYGLSYIPYGDGDDSYMTPNGNSDFYGGGNQFRPFGGDTFDTYSAHHTTGGETPKRYNQQHINTTNWKDSPEKRGNRRQMDMLPNGQDENFSNNATTFNPKLKMAQMKGDKQVRDYFNGKSRYSNGHWS